MNTQNATSQALSLISTIVEYRGRDAWLKTVLQLAWHLRDSPATHADPMIQKALEIFQVETRGVNSTKNSTSGRLVREMQRVVKHFENKEDFMGRCLEWAAMVYEHERHR
jgi:hypothetical protein